MSKLLILVLMLVSCLESESRTTKNHQNQKFRVLGYLFSPSDWAKGLEDIDFGKYTDVNLAFIDPDEEGKFKREEVFEQLVKKAHANQARIFISIGGGGPPGYLGEFLKPGQREAWIEEIIAFTLEYAFDGVDVDLENALINEHYAPFVVNLSKRLREEGRLMTAALASWNGDKIADETLAMYDFINIMSYDATGPWNLEKPGQHSPYEMVVGDFNYYHQERKIPAEKLLIGLPFYGYGFGPGAPRSLRYHQIISEFPDAHQSNTISFPEGGKLFYNNPVLIRKKVTFAMESGAAGVMVWHVQADTEGPYSLLDAIYDAF